MKRILFALLLLFGSGQAFAVCAPILGLGSVQIFDNNGKPLPTGVLYSFQAGTSTQQSTWTDSTCSVLNNNPITMTSGGRANIWLLGSNVYKFVACLQNDGPTCAPADVLFSVDQVPGSPSGIGSPFTGIFISSSTNPATSGILELASSDLICWRNAANSANLCISKDTSDVLSWAGGDFKMPEINCLATSAGFDYLCADNTLHRWTMFNNNGTKTQIVGAGVDINNSDQVTGWHFGAQATPLSSTALTAGQIPFWNGTNIIGSVPGIVIANAGVTGTTLSTLTKLTGAPSTAVIAATTDTAGVVGITCGGAGTAGNATICQTGQASCVFDGATTAGDYVGISSTTGGNCHDVGAASGSGQLIGRVLSTNGGGGTYTIDLFPPEQKTGGILAQSTTTTLANTAIGNSNTTVITKAVTMPVSGCPCRVQANWWLYLNTANSGQDVAYVSDGTAGFAGSETATTGSASGYGFTGSGGSTITYANSANITFNLIMASSHAGGTTVDSAQQGTAITGSPASALNLLVFPSN